MHDHTQHPRNQDEAATKQGQDATKYRQDGAQQSPDGTVLPDPVEGVKEDDDGEETFTKTKRFYALTCPECGETASGEVLGKNFCGECGETWAVEDIENCVECGNPLGGSTAICHTCFSEEEQ